MSEDKLNFLGGEPASVEPSEEVPSDSATAESVAIDRAAEGPQRGPDGRFLTAVPVTSPPAKGPEDRESRLREDGHVPISALLDEREKRQAEKAQREALERQIVEMRARAAPPPELAPTEQLEVALYSQNLRASRRFAEREYGKDTVAAIHDWAAQRCDEDPSFNQQMRLSEDPYEAAYHAYHREQILQTVRPDDLAAFKAWQAAQAVAEGRNPTHSRGRGAQPSPATPVPRSLATASGTGGAGAPHTPVGPGLAFASTLNR